MLSTLIAALVVSAVSGAQNNQKFWMHNTNFQNPLNWNLNRVPCENDRVIFPSQLGLAVTLPPGKTVLSALVLAGDGELLLPRDGVMQLGGGGGCRGADIAFTRRTTKGWLDPGNWRPAPDKEFPPPTPHIDRVPCEDDDAVFPDNASFRIQLPRRAMSVRNIQFGAKAMSSSEWQQWLGSETGFRQFVGDDDSRQTAVSIQEPNTDRCSSALGCACVVNQPQEVLSAVCDYARPQCKPPSCYYAVTPLGHCCPICGSFLTVKYDAAFDISSLRTTVNDYLAQDEYAGILAHAKQTPFEPNTVQIVLVEGEQYQENTKKLANILADVILKDMSLGVTKVLVQNAGPAVLGSKLAHAAETVFSTFFVVSICICAVFYVYVYRQGNPFSPGNYRLFQFARFENTAGDDERSLSLAVNEPDLPTAAHPSKAFDNPLYEESPPAAQAQSVYSDLVKREAVQEVTEEVVEEEAEVLAEDVVPDDIFHEVSFDDKS